MAISDAARGFVILPVRTDPLELAALTLALPKRTAANYYADPIGFAREAIRWPVIRGEQTELADYQAEILKAIPQDRRVAFRAPRGSGKTSTEALTVLWFALTRDAAEVDWKILTTSGGERQLKEFLWPEIRLWARRIDWEKLGRNPFMDGEEMLAMTLALRHGRASSAVSDNPRLLEGMHAEAVLVILDEAKSIEVPVWDSLEGSMSGLGEVFVLAGSTAGETSGRFYEICSRQAGLEDWKPFHVTWQQVVDAKRGDPEWEAMRRLQWGVESQVYRNNVLAEFASSDENSVIPLAWVEKAIARWHEWDDAGRLDPPGRRVIGVDVADEGRDNTVLVSRQGDIVMEIEKHPLGDPMVTVGRVVEKLFHPNSLAVVDSIGVGSGVVARLREQHKPVVAFNAAERSERKDQTGTFGFVNQRAEGWWRLRELLDPSGNATLALPDDPELIGDLTAPHWVQTSSGKVRIEEKAEIRKRLKRSTDVGDAIIHSLSVSGYSGPGVQAKAVPWSDATDPLGITGAVRWEDAPRQPAAANHRDTWGGSLG